MIEASTPVRDVKLFINGQFRDALSGKTFASINPATGQVIARVAEAGPEDVEDAVAAARQAFDEGPWPRMKVAERAAILRRIAEGILKRKEELARLESLDTGKSIREALDFDLPRVAHNFRFFADFVEQMGSECYPKDGDHLFYVLREPVGVVGLIVPWNFPLMLASWKLAPCLAVGNCAILKPAEQTPITAFLLAEICAEAGLPEGVLNVLPGFGPDGAGQAIVSHPGVDAVSFTGETATGRAIMAAAAPTVKRLSFEMGGKSPDIVFGDADLDQALQGALWGIYMNQGEVCLAGPRIFVQRNIYDEFVHRFAEAARRIRIGDPLDRQTEMGPLISQEHWQKVMGYVQIGQEEGAHILCGGKKPALPPPFDAGFFLEPTVMVNVDHTYRVCREEIFGPVATIMPFDTEEEALRLANDTKYGLVGMVWTRDLARAHRVAAKIRAGTIWVNCFFIRDLRVPFGGYKDSGIEREGGIYSINFFTEQKTVGIALHKDAILPPVFLK